MEQTFTEDLAIEAKITATNTRGEAARFSPKNLTDQRRETYWTTDDSVTSPEVVLRWPHPVSFNVVELREFLPLGQRVEAVSLNHWVDGKWVEFANATSIGNRRLIRVPAITTESICVRITKAAACPALTQLSVYREPTDKK